MTVAAIEFESLVGAHYENLFRFALSLTASEADACDLTQQTFYRWAERGHQLRDAAKVKSWLFTTLHREFLRSRRRERSFPHLHLEDQEHLLPPITPEVVSRSDGATVMAALLEVDELYRAPLVHFYLEDLSYREIAECLDVPIGTVMSRLSRGKEQLRALLAVKTARQGRKIVPLPATRAAQA